MAGTETKRIIELTEASTVQSGDFIAVDSNARGTKKVSTDALATSAALTAETNARAGADEQMSERMDGIEEQTALIQNPTKTLSGALCSFTDGADMPMVACTASIVPKQSGSGTPSPENVRPISGWESVSVNVTGKNILKNERTTATIGGVTFTVNEDKSVTVNGTATQNAYFLLNTSRKIEAKAGVTYRLTGCPSGGSGYIIYNDSHGMSDSGSGSTYTPTADDTWEFFIRIANGTTVNNVLFKPMLRVKQTGDNDEYEPYNGTINTTTLGRTVYGGTLDVVTGVLTVDKVGVDLGSLTWSKYGNYTDKDRYLTTGIDSTVKNDEANAICSIYPRLWGANGWWISSGSGKLSIFTTYGQYSSVSAFKTAMSGQILCYPLATPQTYTLTGQEVNTLLGENNVWADSGDVEITYRRDISIVLENLENALGGSNSLNTMMMSAPTENTAEEPTEDEAEDDMR